MINSVYSTLLFGQVNQFDINDEQYAKEDLVMGKDGEGYVVMVWTDKRDAWYFQEDILEIMEGEEAAIYGQIYDPDLNPVGSNFRISEPIGDGTTGSFNLDLLVLHDSRFIVTWQKAERTEGGYLHSSIIMMVMDRDGEILVPEQTVNDHHGQVHRWKPQVSQVPENRFLITWSDLREEKRYIYGQYYDIETGQALGDNVRLGPDWLEPNNFRQYMISDKSYLLIYHNRYIQYYNASNEPEGELIDIVEAYDAGHEQLTVFQPFGTDSLMVLHRSLKGGQTQYFDQMWFSFADPDGTPRSEPVLINDNEPLQMNSGFNVAVNESDGSFLFVWEDRRNSAPVRLSLSVADIYAQRFDANARPIGSNFKVNHEPREKGQLSPQILHHRNHHFVVVWAENRLIRCPVPDGGLIVNMMDSYQLGIYMDFHQPDPGPVWGWENYVEHRNDYYRTHCGFSDRPEKTQMIGNYPNPFNYTTNIVFELDVEETVEIDINIFDLMGRRVRTLQLGYFAIGRHEVSFDASGLASGMYIARMQSPQLPGFSDTTKLLLTK